MKYVFEGLLSLALLLLVCAPGTGGKNATSSTPSAQEAPGNGINSNPSITNRQANAQSTTEASTTKPGNGNGNAKTTASYDGRSTTMASGGSGATVGGGGGNSGTTTSAKPQPMKGEAGRVVVSVPLLLLSVLM